MASSTKNWVSRPEENDGGKGEIDEWKSHANEIKDMTKSALGNNWIYWSLFKMNVNFNFTLIFYLKLIC